MKEEKSVAVHDPVVEMKNKIYGIFKKCGGEVSLGEILLEYLSIITPIIFLVTDYLKWKFSFCILIVFFVLLFIYCKVIDFRTSNYYVKKLGIKPSKTNVFVSFSNKCSDEKIALKEIEDLCEYVDVEIKSEELSDFSSPIILTTVLTLLGNRVEIVIALIKSNVPTDLYAFIIPLLICIYLIVFFISTLKLRRLVLFKKCLIYAKIICAKSYGSR